MTIEATAVDAVQLFGPEPDDQPPDVTAVVSCYNMRDLIARTLQSMANQIAKIEIVVIDDGSSDGSADAIRAWAKEATVPGTFIARTVNGGLPASLNTCLEHARGRFVSVLGHDDQWLPHMTARHVELLEAAGPEYAVAYGDAAVEDPNGDQIAESFLDLFRPGRRPEGDLFLEFMYGMNFLHPSATTIRRSALSEAGPYDTTIRLEDFDMWLRIAAGKKFLFSGTTDAIITLVPGRLSEELGPDLFRAFLVSLSKFRTDPRVDRRRLRGVAANLVLGMAGARAFTPATAIEATRAGARLYRDPLLVPQSLRLFARVAASRTRNRLANRRLSASR